MPVSSAACTSATTKYSKFSGEDISEGGGVYKSCFVQQRGNYTTLVAELTKKFTPVRLKAVQSGLFHERKQKVPSESVDTYAQDLR